MSQLWERAKDVLIDGTGTFSKKPSSYIEQSYPSHCIGGSGSTIIGDNNKRYTDWVCALGANLLEVNNSFSLPHIAEIELAELIIEKFPCDKIKILKTGSEACLAAVRYARAHTGRKQVYGWSYHGWGDCFISAEHPGKGCINGHYTKFNYPEMLLSMLEACDDDNMPAAVIVEPCILDVNVRKTIEAIRNFSYRKNIVFIADEIVSGGRVQKYCFSNYWELNPDIICLGKGLAGGYPISFCGVKNHINTEDVFVSTTFSGEFNSIKSCINTLKSITEKKLDRIWSFGIYIQTEINNAAKENDIDFGIKGYPTRAAWTGNKLVIAMFCELMLSKGHLLHPGVWFISFAHNEIIITRFLEDAKDCMKQIKNGYRLKGIINRPPFERNK